MTAVDVEEVEARFPLLLAAVEEQGETIVICRCGTPVVELKPPSVSYDQTEPLSDGERPSDH